MRLYAVNASFYIRVPQRSTTRKYNACKITDIMGLKKLINEIHYSANYNEINVKSSTCLIINTFLPIIFRDN